MKRTGRVTVKVDGDAFASLPGASLSLGGVEREVGMTDQRTTWHQEEDVPSEIKATLVHVSGLDLPALRDTTDAVATYECDTGVVYSVRDCVFKSMGELSDGQIEVVLGGAPAEQVS